MSNSSLAARRRAAFTLVEVLVALAVGSLALAALATLAFHSARSFVAMNNHLEMERQGRAALDRMSRSIRQCVSLTSLAPGQASFDFDGATTLTYAWSEEAKQLTETYAGETTVLLEGCTALSFEAFQRGALAGSFDHAAYQPGLNTARVVRVSWTCSRDILGKVANVQNAQSGQIILRQPEP